MGGQEGLLFLARRSALKKSRALKNILPHNNTPIAIYEKRRTIAAMKRYFLLPLLFCLATTVSAQKPSFNIRYSEQLAVFEFIRNLSPNYPPNKFKTLFENSAYNNNHFQQLIKELDELPIDYSYSFQEYPYGSKIPMQTRDMLKKNLIETASLSEFKIRTVGLLPNKTISDLAGIINAFTPVYNELIFNPNKEIFLQQLADIKKYSVEKNMQQYFETGILFYNSTWDNSVPFEVALYPMPDPNGFTAQAFYNNFIGAVQTNLKDYLDLFSVMLHETYHIIYDEQSLEVKIQLNNYFKENNSASSNYAKLLLNEALATALANGYVYESINGSIDKNDWYYHPYIDQMARKLFPVVKEYIRLKKPMDKNFIDTYISLYQDNFPNWINEMPNIMTYRYVLSEDKEDFRIIRRLFRYSSSFKNEDEITAASIDRMLERPVTKLIIVSKNHAEKLSLIKKKFPELASWNYNPGKEFTYKILLRDKTQLIIVNKKGSSTEMLIKEIR